MIDKTESPIKVSREKLWGELDSDKKIERMHYVVRELQSRVVELRGVLIALQQHDHDRSGQVVVNIRQQNYNVVTTPIIEQSDVWF